MRILGRDPSEIVPHAGSDVCDLSVRKLGQRAAEVEPGAFGNAEPRADCARQRPTDRRCPIERHQPERTKAQRRSLAFNAMSEAGPAAAMPRGPFTRLALLGI